MKDVGNGGLDLGGRRPHGTVNESGAGSLGSDDRPPIELDGKAMPEPPAERSGGPIRSGRGSMLQDKVAVVTGAAREAGRLELRCQYRCPRQVGVACRSLDRLGQQSHRRT